MLRGLVVRIQKLLFYEEGKKIEKNIYFLITSNWNSTFPSIMNVGNKPHSGIRSTCDFIIYKIIHF